MVISKIVQQKMTIMTEGGITCSKGPWARINPRSYGSRFFMLRALN